MAIQSTGVGSGLDVTSIVAQLMAVERQPLAALDTKQSGITAKLSAYGSLKSVLGTLQTAAAAAADATKYNTAAASVADATLASASAAAGTSAGSHSLEVQALAQAQKMKSAAFATSASALGSGTLTVEFGSYAAGAFTLNPDRATKTIRIPPGANTVAAVRDAINAAGAGISASIVNDGSGPRLVIGSDQTGTANALRITVADNDGDNGDAAGLSQLAYDASTGGLTQMSQTIAAQDALVVVDGITVKRSTNSVSDAIEGVTLQLLKAAPGAPTTLNVARNSSAASAAITAFVKAYNSATTSMASMSAYNPETKQGAVLQGDSMLIALQSRLRSTMGGALAYAGGYQSLSELGVGFQRDGTLAIDSAKLQAALADPSKDVASVFAAMGKTTDSLVSWTHADADAAPGSYAINVTQIATQGKAAGAAPAALVIGAGVNDTLQLTVDGTAATVTLAAGTYTASSLAAALQARINGVSALSAAGAAVTVAESGGVLTVNSARYGAVSSVAISGGNAATDLFGAAVSTAGVDAQGSIGGKAATGSGRFLTAKGLTVEIEGGATGARGSLTFTRGYGDQLNTLIDGLMDSTIATRTSGLNASSKAIDRQREMLNARLDSVEKRYRAQFVALDNMVASMNSTSSYLTQQLAALPKIGGN